MPTRPTSIRPPRRVRTSPQPFDFPELGQDVQRQSDAIREGVPVARVTVLSESLDVPFSEVLGWLDIPPATMARRVKSGRLGRSESERALRLGRLLGRASDVFGGLDRGRRWLQEPQFALGGATPLQYAETEPGALEVERLIGRIEHGIPA